jgi:hypothetical protein
MCLIELVDFNEIYSNESAKKTTRRSRRGGVKKSNEAIADNAEVVEESNDVVVDVASAEVVQEESVDVTEESSEVVADENTDSNVESNEGSEEASSNEDETKKD